MRAVRAILFTGLVAMAAGAASAAGTNGIFNLNRDGSQGIIQDLTDDKALFDKESDKAKFDKAIALLSAAPETPLSQTASVKAFQGAMVKLSKLAKNENVAPDLAEAVDTLYFQVYGYNASAASSVANYYSTHTGRKDLLAYGRIVFAFAKRIAKLESTQGGGKLAGKTPAQKASIYLGVTKAGDALIKKFGPPPG